MLPIRNTRSLLQASSRAAVVFRRPVSAALPRVSTTITLNQHAGAAAPSIRLPSTAQRAAFATKTSNGFQKGIDTEEEKKFAQQKLTPHPERVSMESSVRHLYEPSPPDKERPVPAGIKDDLETVKETFSLANAPDEPYWLGLAGTLPYLGTSLSTVYLAWVLNTPWPAPSAFANNIMINQETASHLMSILEPIQLGYGAVIISFLGAVHWGLEYAAKVPDQARTRFRYGVGVAAPIFAWPTLFLPVEFALISQFAAFVALYFADARATVRGWAPAWYSTYRFALTAVVGVAIAISLIGRAKVGDASPRLTGLNEKFHQHRGEEEYTQKWQEREQKEVQKIKQQEKEAEEKEAEEKKKKEEEEKKKKEEEEKKKPKKGGEKEGKEKKKDQESKTKENDKSSEEGKDAQEGGKEKGSEEKGGEEKGDEEKGDEEKGDKK
ncbi:hypothetical protein F5Y07DRAFT_311906 [Xylaria sp. FL0933]|nr:hypothetical protein F5Y07DRAFT_311906 [Xylaria sp. FL0933]